MALSYRQFVKLVKEERKKPDYQERLSRELTRDEWPDEYNDFGDGPHGVPHKTVRDH
jgi:hypothetical protein